MNRTTHVRIQARFLELLYGAQYAFALLLGVVTLVLAAGFLVGGDSTNSNYDTLLRMFTPIQWSVLLAFHGVVQLARSVQRLPFTLVFVNSVVGIWLWCVIVTSFTLFDTTPTAPTEYLLAVPAILEVWLLAHVLFWRGFDRRSRDSHK